MQPAGGAAASGARAAHSMQQLTAPIVPMPPALETVAARSAPVIWPIPAHITGCSIPSMCVSAVGTAAIISTATTQWPMPRGPPPLCVYYTAYVRARCHMHTTRAGRGQAMGGAVGHPPGHPNRARGAGAPRARGGCMRCMRCAAAPLDLVGVPIRLNLSAPVQANPCLLLARGSMNRRC
eukprot:COSAG01_NODE_3597_length_5894_cov_1.898188_2_plen_180_part_00